MRSHEKLRAALLDDGPNALLSYLNAGVPHRYTALYRFEGDLLRNVALCDKQGKIRPDFLLAVPFRHSFCQFVLRDQAFRTDDSRFDKRLDGNPYQGLVISYHSVPVSIDGNALWGTLSHFDMRRHPLADSEFDLLQAAAGLLGSYITESVED
ncbi:GAF domain-containing protein [Variovorax dokdonensis]|uniref:GAF domain-containing protein n=1 Tax=Variovorax dokdonensis TaxID=344883 RepID=A0ABT7N5Y1_9BURK|nr:GAF domain-containing protein [Variovorax dokdonensis]MDM0043280.1 GAF domain-containing protein [Variovorax dokdonensis]